MCPARAQPTVVLYFYTAPPPHTTTPTAAVTNPQSARPDEVLSTEPLRTRLRARPHARTEESLIQQRSDASREDPAPRGHPRRRLPSRLRRWLRSLLGLGDAASPSGEPPRRAASPSVLESRGGGGDDGPQSSIPGGGGGGEREERGATPEPVRRAREAFVQRWVAKGLPRSTAFWRWGVGGSRRTTAAPPLPPPPPPNANSKQK